MGKVALVTLKKNREFAMVYGRGKSHATKTMAMVYLPRKYGGVRAGFSVSKKVGKSVVRNKVRRRMKEAFLEILPEISKSAHVIFIARAPIAAAEYQTIRKEMRYLIKKFGLIAQVGGEPK